MKKYIIQTRSDQMFLKIQLAATYDEIDFSPDQKKMNIEFSEFEAYRTGIPEIKKLLKPRVCSLYSEWYDWSGSNPIDCLDTTSMSPKRNLECINKHYNEPAKIYGCLSPTIYTCGDYLISFERTTRIPLITYKPLYSGKDFNPITYRVKDFMENQGIYETFCGTQRVNKEEVDLLRKRMKDLVSY